MLLSIVIDTKVLDLGWREIGLERGRGEGRGVAGSVAELANFLAVKETLKQQVSR